MFDMDEKSTDNQTIRRKEWSKNTHIIQFYKI